MRQALFLSDLCSQLNKSIQRGFTLIEILITLAILALLASLATPTIELVVKRQKEQALKTSLREIRQAIDAYKHAVDEGKIERTADESGYPPNLNLLYQGAVDQTDPEKKRKIYLMRRLPRDPLYPDRTQDAAATWGKRSYASSYDKPQEGKDVYDIYSLSPDKAINGTLYRTW